MAIPMLVALALAAAPARDGQSRQQVYEAAQAAFDKGEWVAAESGFARVLAPSGRSSRSDGIMRARYATALGALGRKDDAVAEARRAVAEFPAAGTDEERAIALLALARLLTVDFALDQAATISEQARDAAPADSPIRLTAATLAVQSAAVADPKRAIRDAELLQADPLFAGQGKDQQALVLSLKARAYLNAGDGKAAIATINKAISLTGAVGTGNTKVTLLQAVVRGDAALIHARAGDTDKAKEYLAYSGAGYLPQTGWWGDGNREPPVCGDDVKPDDVAVVAFALDEQGKPIAAEAVYASRPGPMGAIFAAAVREWDPSPTVGKLSLFWRTSLRIEMRCVTRPAPLAIAAEFRTKARGWWMRRHVEMPDLTQPIDKKSGEPDTLIDRLRAATKGKDGVAALAPVDDVLASAEAPVEVRAVFAQNAIAYRGIKLFTAPNLQPLTIVIDRLAKMPEGGRAAAWLRLESALATERSGHLTEARPILEEIVALPEGGLPADDPIRMIATLHLSMVDQKQGAGDAARERLRRAGLDAEQCSRFDVSPLPVNQSVSNSIFPSEAMRWGFDGYVKESFDIGADGHVIGARTIIAYPAFVFGSASESAVARFRYLPPTLDGKVLGCSAQTTNFRFKAWRP